MRWHSAPRFCPGWWHDRYVITGVAIYGATIGIVLCYRHWFAAGVTLAQLQVNHHDVERLLLLIDIAHLGGEPANDFFQPVEP
jgi:hypothetical protein